MARERREIFPKNLNDNNKRLLQGLYVRRSSVDFATFLKVFSSLHAITDCKLCCCGFPFTAGEFHVSNTLDFLFNFLSYLRDKSVRGT